MASNGEFTVEDALNILENLTETNGNLKNGVKKDILTAVSCIKNEFVFVKSEVESANRRITELEARATETHSLLLLTTWVDTEKRSKRHLAASEGTTTATVRRRRSPSISVRSRPAERRRGMREDAVCGCGGEKQAREWRSRKNKDTRRT